MNRWSAETRNRVIVLALGTIGVLALIWLLLIGTLQARLGNQKEKLRLVQDRLVNTRERIQRAEKFDEEVARSSLLLSGFENQMAQGDQYRWVLGWLRSFEARHKITVSSPPPPQEMELDVPPKVPYRAVVYSISGTARYHDFGAFLADIENSSPFIRLNSLSLAASASGIENVASSDRLAFQLEFVTLLKPATTRR
jgi:Tfp pilus assembly protein PilO